MRVLLPQDHPDRPILLMAALAFVCAIAVGLVVDPMLYWLAFCLGIASCVVILLWRFTTAFCVAWLLVTAASLEMALNDLGGPGWFGGTIAAVKGGGLLLAAVCMLRFGPRFDLSNPALAYLFMLIAGWTHGLFPGLTMADSVRSFIGSAAPFAFAFARVPRSWADAMIAMTKWCPLLVVLAAVPLAVFGLRPLFKSDLGWRLAGLGHPAFLANVCLPAIYACLIELFRSGERSNLGLLALNFLILLLTGARAPLAYAVAVTVISMLSVPAPKFPQSSRWLLLLGTAALLPVLIALAATCVDIRIFNVAGSEAANLSGRDLLWPAFREAAARSPWFGWGIGAGNLVIPPDSEVAKTLQTWAAHNEYLRMAVEGGEIGRALLIMSFIGWVTLQTRHLAKADRMVIRLAFVAFGFHAITDNVLISTPASVLFAFTTAVFVRRTPDAPGFALPDSRCLA